MASAYGLPEDLWIWILVMALIILALLWKDKISGGSSGSSSTTTPTRDDPPSVSMSLARGSSKKKGEEFKLRGRYDSGDGTISSKTLKMNGRSISGKISSWSGGTFSTEPITVPDKDGVRCKVGVRTKYGSDEDTVSFTPVDRGGGEDEGPTLNVDVTTTDTEKNDSTGAVKITASPTPGDTPIKVTVVDAGSIGQEEKRGSGDCIFKEEGLPAGEYPYRAATEDRNDKTEEIEDTFRIEEGDTGPRDTTTGGGGPGGFLLNNNQNEIINEFNVPPEIVGLLENIVDQTGDKGDGDVTQEVSMEGYQLLLAMHMLQNDIDSGDNQQIVNELQQINNSLQNNQISADELENSLRTVLHQVFDMDIQDLFSDLGVEVSADNNFDSDQIVKAINKSSTDIGPIVNRLSNIENAVNQLQNQGNGDLGDIEMKLDQIVNAVNNAGMDQEMMQTFISEIGDLQSKGVDVDVGDIGNNNGADVNNLMMMRLVDDIRHRDNPDREMERILEVIKRQGRLNRKLILELIDEEEEGGDGVDPDDVDPEEDPIDDSGGDDLDRIMEVSSSEMDEFRSDVDLLSEYVEELNELTESQRKEVELESEVKKLGKKALDDIEDAIKHAKVVNEITKDLGRVQPNLDNSNAITSKLQNAAKHEVEIRKDLKDLHDVLTKLAERASELHKEYQYESELRHDQEDFFSAVQEVKDHIKRIDQRCQTINDVVGEYREMQGSAKNHPRGDVLGESRY